MRPYAKENLERNYTSVAIFMKSMAMISPLRKAYVNVTSRKHFYNMYNSIVKKLYKFKNLSQKPTFKLTNVKSHVLG